MQITEIILNVFIWAPGILFAITLHEWAHGYVATRFGDPTPSVMGRLTLNPLPHIDLVWTILIPGAMLIASLLTTGRPFVFGGAKPVPINPGNFRGSFRMALLSVSIAGPVMNLLLAFFCAIAFQGALYLPGLFKIYVAKVLLAAIQMNVLLAVFNLIPLPPLDGGRVATALLPSPLNGYIAKLEPFGLPIILLLAFSGLLGKVLWPIMAYVLSFYLSVAGI